MSTPTLSSTTQSFKSESWNTRRVTLREVAERAGVQQACVSVVINGAKSNAHVSQLARERILQAAEELGYKRNGSMATMANGRFGCVALLLSTKHDVSVLPSQVWEGIHDELARQNVHLTLFRLSDAKLSDKKFLPKIMREWMADGMVIDYTHNIPDSLKALIVDHALPAVWLNSKQEFDCIRPDDFGAGKLATQHLLGMGHKRIAYMHLYRFADENLDHYSSGDRYEGYLAAMEAAGCKPQSFLARGLPANKHGAWIEEALKNEDERPTAIVTYGDEAEAVIWAALRLGLEIPRDLSLVGLSPRGGVWSGLELTTWVVPEAEIGRRAAMMIQQKIMSSQQKMNSLVIPFTFYPGDSTAPPSS